MTREEEVARLPRRTAHALHALIEVARAARSMPLSAREILHYDDESLSGQQTGAGLRHARRLGLAIYLDPWWVPTSAALDLAGPLEERVLADLDGHPPPGLSC